MFLPILMMYDMGRALKEIIVNGETHKLINDYIMISVVYGRA